MYQELGPILQQIMTCGYAIELLMTSVKTGGAPWSLWQNVGNILGMFEQAAETAQFAHIFNQPSSQDDVWRDIGRRAHALLLKMLAVSARIECLDNLVGAKYGADLNDTPSDIMLTSAALAAHVGLLEDLLRQAVAAGYIAQEHAELKLDPVDSADLDFPIAMMTEEEAQRDYGTNKAGMKTAAAIFMRFTELEPIISVQIARVVENLARVCAVTIAALTPNIDESTEGEFDQDLAGYETFLQSLDGYAELLDQSVVRMGPSMESISSGWNCPGLGEIVARVVQPPAYESDQSASREHSGAPFSEGAVGRQECVRLMMISLVDQHGRLLTGRDLGGDLKRAYLVSRRILSALEQGYQTLLNCRRLEGGMRQDGPAKVEQDELFGSMIIDAVKITLANSAARAIFLAHQTVCNWLRFAAHLLDGPHDPEGVPRGMEALLQRSEQAYRRIHEVGMAFNRSDLSAAQLAEAEQSDSISSNSGAEVPQQAADDVRASNSLVKSGADLEEIYQTLLEISRERGLQSISRTQAPMLRDTLNAATHVVEVSYGALLEVNVTLVEALDALGYKPLARAVERLF